MPINKGVSSRSVVIQKDLLAARDVRMNIMVRPALSCPMLLTGTLD